MCESAMINMYGYLFPDALTNIQNGHASEKEKNSRTHTTKTYEISEFLKEVCIETVFYEETLLSKKRCMFIKIHGALPNYDKDCKDTNTEINYDEYIYQCTQGYWPRKLEMAKRADYVIALQNTVVKGVYPVAKWMKVTELLKCKEAPIYPITPRKDDTTNSDKNFLKRIGFVKIDESALTDEQQTELDLIKSQVLNKQIKEKETDTNKKVWFKEQNSVFNYDDKAKIKENLRQ